MEGMAGLLWVLAVILVVVGVAGTVLPALPGAPLVFAGLVVAAWAEGFEKVGWITLTLIGLLTLLTFAVDFLASTLGAKRVGASWMAVVGATLGIVAGFFLGLPGLLLGPFVGAFLGEYLARRDWAQARRAGIGTWIGFLLGTVLKLTLIFAMIGLFAAAYFF
ncbi:MAG TPA: DUF456 family protein [Thermoanaerobaculia bacterium]|nr:DUF456 family protein [Thermoanaerobaculia bacterium]